MKITITVEEREGAPAYVAKCGDYPEIWSYCSHFVDNPNPLRILESWASHFEALSGVECDDLVIAAMEKVKDHKHIDDVTRRQLKDAKADRAEEQARREMVLES